MVLATTLKVCVSVWVFVTNNLGETQSLVLLPSFEAEVFAIIEKHRLEHDLWRVHSQDTFIPHHLFLVSSDDRRLFAFYAYPITQQKSKV